MGDDQPRHERNRAHSDQLETIIGSIAEAVFVCDAQANITLVNGAGLALMGKERGEPLGTVVDFIDTLQLRFADGRPVPPDDLAVSRALSRGEVEKGREAVGIHPRSGQIIDLLISAAPLRDEQGQVVGAVEVVADISKLKKLDRLKEQFLTVAAHELKTPVTIVKGYAQALLHRGGDLAPHVRRMLEAIDRGSSRIDRIVKDLLDLSKLHSGYLELGRARTDLAALAAEAVDRMALTTERHRLRLTLEHVESAVVQGDRDRIEQALIDLIDNAKKYSPNGGDIDVVVSRRGGEVVVSVQDYGIGIPSEKQGRIFERFYSAHTGTRYDYGGMGIGLYLSAQIIARHGGRIWFESEESKGSTFFFSLPLAAG